MEKESLISFIFKMNFLKNMVGMGGGPQEEVKTQKAGPTEQESAVLQDMLGFEAEGVVLYS